MVVAMNKDAISIIQQQAEAFRGCALHFRAVGDCKSVRKLKQAVEEGYLAGLDVL